MRIFTVYLNLFYYKSFYSSMFKMNFLNAYTKLQTHTETIFFFHSLGKIFRGVNATGSKWSRSFLVYEFVCHVNFNGRRETYFDALMGFLTTILKIESNGIHWNCVIMMCNSFNPDICSSIPI